MQTVFLFINHHSHIADLLNTRYIEYLSGKYKVHVFVPDRPGAASLKERRYFKNSNIEYHAIELRHSLWWRRFKLLRVPTIRQFDSVTKMQDEYKRKKHTDWRRSALRFFSFLAPWIFTTGFYTRLEGLIIPDEAFFRDAVKSFSPVLVITATPGFTPFEAWAVLLSKKHNIPSCAVNFSWDNLTAHARAIRKTDYLVCWNEINKREAINIHGYSPDKVFVSGPVRFDHYFSRQSGELSREEFLRSKGLDPEKKTILIATMSANNYAYHRELIDTLVSYRLAGRTAPVNIFVRVHPIDSFLNYQDLTEKNIPDFHIERAGTLIKEDINIGQKVQMNRDDFLNTKHTLMYTDIDINPFSTFSLESMVFDKPVINIGIKPEFRPALYYVHYKPITESKAVKVAMSYEDLLNHINHYLAHPEDGRAERKKIVSEYLAFTDGENYKRSVDFLERCIGSKI